MPLFGKKPGGPPSWAHPLSAEKYALFVSTVGETLDAIGAADQRKSIGDGLLHLPNSEGSVESYGLQNLAQILAMEPTPEWHRLVAEHFDTMLTVDRPPLSGDVALPSLRVRMWHPDYVQGLPNAVYKTLAPGLVLALVLDMPRKVMGVSTDRLKTWGLSEELAWDAAEKNSKREPVEVIPQPRPDGPGFFFLVGDHLYVTSHGLWLDEHIEIDHQLGALVGVPTRHLLVVLPLRKIRDLQAVPGMHVANRNIYDDGPGSISVELYWWRAGKFALMPIDTSVTPARVTPPDEFVAMLEVLAARERAGG